jgi:polar amino acid transport system substrate-binding protein
MMITTKGRTARVASTLAALLLVALTGCSIGAPESGSGGSDASASSASAGAPLNVAVFLQYPPFRYQDADNQPAGLEIDMMNAVAQRMGREVVYHNVPFDSIIPGISTGRYDFALGQMMSRPQNVDQVDVMEWVNFTVKMLVPAGNPGGIDPADLCGRRIAAVSSSTEFDVQQKISRNICAPAGRPAVESLPFPDTSGMVTAVLSGQAETMMIDPVVGQYLGEQAGGRLEVLPGNVPEMTWTPLGWVFPNDDTTNLPAVRDAIVAMHADGSWERLIAPAGLEPDALIVPPTVDSAKAP